ncbi:hypothetical protein BWI93_23965 [Siphonobacter sp. BAB-5385]|nr:hypothetical protein BWI93_23965 [Siphonobacter sp. BAB-5385]
MLSTPLGNQTIFDHPYPFINDGLIAIFLWFWHSSGMVYTLKNAKGLLKEILKQAFHKVQCQSNVN